MQISKEGEELHADLSFYDFTTPKVVENAFRKFSEKIDKTDIKHYFRFFLKSE